MPITVKHKDIFSPGFLGALKALSAQYRFPFKVAYNIGRIVKQVEKLEKEQGVLLKEIAQKFFKKDEKGNWIPMKDANGRPIPMNFELDDTIEDCKKKYQDSHDEFMELEQVLQSNHLSPDDFVMDGKPIEIQPAIIQEIDCLFGDAPVLELHEPNDVPPESAPTPA